MWLHAPDFVRVSEALATIELMFEDDPVAALDEANAQAGAAQLRMLRSVREIAVSGAWRGDGARDLPHWLSMRFGISWWKTRKMVATAHALRRLPSIAEALESGRLSLDKALELCRFAHPDTEQGLLVWALAVSVTRVRQKADLHERHTRRQLEEAEADRSLGWWWVDDGRRLVLEGQLPASQGTVFTKALDRMLQKIPVMPGEEGTDGVAARRADALVAICSAKLGADPDPERSQIVVHASPESLSAVARREARMQKAVKRGEWLAEFEDGSPVHPQVLSRLLCSSKVQTVIEGSDGQAISLGRSSRDPSPAMMLQLRYRDRGCRFPACGSEAFNQAHHVEYWSRGGKTSLANLILLCSFHHRLIHDRSWSVGLDHGQVLWRRPNGALFRAGPSPGSGPPTRRDLHPEHRGSHSNGPPARAGAS